MWMEWVGTVVGVCVCVCVRRAGFAWQLTASQCLAAPPAVLPCVNSLCPLLLVCGTKCRQQLLAIVETIG